ncbi:MAG TPA: di-heme oxidoredictase family protein [Bryobacteraceae bacterium]|nr:di-heme oxidoredictase family protein [Bryobacteraceae bacterium]
MKSLILTILSLALASAPVAHSRDSKIAAPRVWNDKELADWATPVAGLNVRPDHFSEREYYAAPEAELFRTYPVYLPGREPLGYSEFIANVRPEALIRPGPRTKAEWINAGQIVFREMDVPATRSYDPELIAMARSAEALMKAGAKPQADGSIAGLRWTPTGDGLALSVEDCGGCHTRTLENGVKIDGAPSNARGNALLGRLVSGAIFRMYGDTPKTWTWRSAAAPWIPDDVHANIRELPEVEYRALFRRIAPGVFARFNGSPLFPTKVPDLIGIGERRYIDHTATHRLRGMGDVMRYAALVSCCDSADFGPHRLLTDGQRKIVYRFSDDALFALAQYIFALKPPANPNRTDPRIRLGQRIFHREGCARCHTPPFYTNNKLTTAEGYQPSKSHPYAADIVRVSVRTDANLALRTRKGTGLYKVPSLKGVWYRGRFHPDGAVTS